MYYAPRLPFTQAVTFPTLFGAFPLLRCVLLRERIALVHAHQVTRRGCLLVHGGNTVLALPGRPQAPA